jgi:NitT/TauT family transport system substrate-binding protein
VHDISDGADVIIATPEVITMNDIRGKRVGVESGALGAFVITRALEKNGLSLNDIQIKNINVNMHEEAFNKGDVDAVVTFEPVRTKLLSVGANEIFTSREIPSEIVDVLVVHQDFVNENPQVIEQLVDGWFKALTYMETNKTDAAVRMAKRLKITPEEVTASYEGLVLPDRLSNHKLLGGDKPVLDSTLRELNRIMVEKGLLKNTIDTSKLLTDEFLTKGK